MSSLPIVVFETFGLLEEIFSYGTAVDLVRSSMVNRRFSEAARTDCFWRALALNQWEDKIGVKYMKGYREEEVRDHVGFTLHNICVVLRSILSSGNYYYSSGAFILENQVVRCHCRHPLRASNTIVLLTSLAKGRTIPIGQLPRKARNEGTIKSVHGLDCKCFFHFFYRNVVWLVCFIGD